MACYVETNQHGNLRFKLYWKGMQWTEGAKKLKDTARNHQRMEARAVLISEEWRLRSSIT